MGRQGGLPEELHEEKPAVQGVGCWRKNILGRGAVCAKGLRQDGAYGIRAHWRVRECSGQEEGVCSSFLTHGEAMTGPLAEEGRDWICS